MPCDTMRPSTCPAWHLGASRTPISKAPRHRIRQHTVDAASASTSATLANAASSSMMNFRDATDSFHQRIHRLDLRQRRGRIIFGEGRAHQRRHGAGRRSGVYHEVDRR